MHEPFKLELAHGLCKDAEVLDSFGTGRDEYSELYHILDSKENVTWLPGKKYGSLRADLMKSRSLLEQVYPKRDKALLLSPKLDHDESIMSDPLSSRPLDPDEPRPASGLLELLSPNISLDSLSADTG